MSGVYSKLFFSGTVADGVTTGVPLSSYTGTLIIRTVRVVCASSLPSLSWAVSVAAGPNFYYAQNLAGPFTDVEEYRDVWPPGFDMNLNCTGSDMDFWLSGYELTP